MGLASDKKKYRWKVSGLFGFFLVGFSGKTKQKLLNKIIKTFAELFFSFIFRPAIMRLYSLNGRGSCLSYGEVSFTLDALL